MLLQREECMKGWQGCSCAEDQPQTQKRRDPFILPAAATAKSLQSCPPLCDPIDGSPPGSLILGILQARTLEWVAISFSNAWKWKVKVKSLSRVRLLVIPWTEEPGTLQSMGSQRVGHDWDFFMGSPNPKIHGILQARVLEWGAIAFSSGFA